MEDITVKHEIEPSISEENNLIVHIKSELEAQNDPDDQEVTNAYDNELQVKEEIMLSPTYSKAVNDVMVSLPTPSNDLDLDIHIKKVDIETENIDAVDENSDGMDDLDVKKEENVDSILPFEYPDFDDSMDSNEAVALGNVEACLQDDGNFRTEAADGFQGHHYHHKGPPVDVKQEQELTVTETHLISNKFINTTSTITNPQDGLIESHTTKTLVMEIHPMTSTAVPLALSIVNPTAILPTPYPSEDHVFQLNSITGNVLSLEQEAYGLLKAKKKQGLKLYVCPKCPKICKKIDALKRHLQVHASIENRKMGILKGLQTRRENQDKLLELTLKERFKHLKSLKTPKTEAKKKTEVKKEGYECTCGQVFRRRSRMETCLRSHNLGADIGAMHKCFTCLKQFKDKTELAMHRKRLHRKKFPCKFCPTDYGTRKELFKHLQVHQKVQLMEYKVISEIMNGKQKLRCFMCSKSYAELSDLKCHVMEDHKEPYICPHCKSTFNKIIDFGNHTKTSHPEIEGKSVLDVLEAFSKLVKAWKCEECGLQFHEADKLALHQIQKHSPDLKADPQLQCSDCRRVFVSQKGLTSHRRIHHSSETIEEAAPVDQGIMCVECRKVCKDMATLTSHMRLHSPERKYPCKYCDFRFATPEKRKAHAEIHTGDLRYVCFICEYQCSSENRLKHHKMSLKHANMKQLLLTGKPLLEEPSNEPTNTSKKKDKKKKKEKESSGKREMDSVVENEVPCEICGEMFPSESVMLEHKQTHPFIEFPNEDKPTRIFFK